MCWQERTVTGSWRVEKGPNESALVSVPCGVCPRINECTPDGVILPVSCVYYSKWLAVGYKRWSSLEQILSGSVSKLSDRYMTAVAFLQLPIVKIFQLSI